MFQKLIVSGCSFGTGINLENPDLDCWPVLLKNKLNCDFVNYSVVGMGNEHIFNSILDHFILNPQDKKNSLVICLITNIQRIEFFDVINKRKFATLTNNKDELSKLFFQNYYDDEYYYIKFLRSVITTQNYLEKNNINYLFFNAVPPIQNIKLSKNKLINNLIKNINFNNYLWFFQKPITDIIAKNAMPCKHPNAKGHELIACFLYDSIVKRYEEIQEYF
jgi:hypothetical protein